MAEDQKGSPRAKSTQSKFRQRNLLWKSAMASAGYYQQFQEIPIHELPLPPSVNRSIVMGSCDATLMSSAMVSPRNSPKSRVAKSQMQERRSPRSQANRAFDKMIECIQYSSKPLDLLKANSRRTSSQFMM